jgi:hypothetical protein
MNEEITQIEYFDDRFYKVNLPEEELKEFCKLHGEHENPIYFPSTTTILGILISPFLLEWYGNLGTERAKFKSRKAADMGSKIHDAVHRLLSGEEIEMETE